MERQDTLINKMGELLTSFKETKVKHMSYTRAMHGITVASFFILDGAESVADELEEKSISQFIRMSNLLARQIRSQTQPLA